MSPDLPPDHVEPFRAGAYAKEIRLARGNHQIGKTLLHQNDAVRVFHTRLAPGERAGFHVHDRNYFWVALTAGRGVQRFGDGREAAHEYREAECQWFVQSSTAYFIHDLINVGESDLVFVTVEVLSS